MNNSDAVIIILYNLFQTKFEVAKASEELNWCVRGLDQKIDEAVVDLIYYDDISEEIHKKLYPTETNFRINVFDKNTCLTKLISASGGNKQVLYKFMRDVFGAVGSVSKLPITESSVQRVITNARDVQRRAVDQKDWTLLAALHLDPLIDCRALPEYQDLIRSQSVFSYTGQPSYWLVNPLIEKIEHFQKALESLQ